MSVCTQVYTPPYLLTGLPQPVLEQAPSSATYGQNITLAFSNTTSIDRVVLSKLADNTHCISMDHRQVTRWFMPVLQVVESCKCSAALPGPQT